MKLEAEGPAMVLALELLKYKYLLYFITTVLFQMKMKVVISLV